MQSCPAQPSIHLPECVLFGSYSECDVTYSADTQWGQHIPIVFPDTPPTSWSKTNYTPSLATGPGDSKIMAWGIDGSDESDEKVGSLSDILEGLLGSAEVTGESSSDNSDNTDAYLSLRFCHILHLCPSQRWRCFGRSEHYVCGDVCDGHGSNDDNRSGSRHHHFLFLDDFCEGCLDIRYDDCESR